MAKQAEAERERRAKVIGATGELQASEQLTEAARVMSAQPGALQLRYLQTVSEIATENNSTTLFPLPLELFRPFLEKAAGAARATAEHADPTSPLLSPPPIPLVSERKQPERVVEPDAP
jgi:regulator of protease activity HflC (stomatin/prohibitin superfamily)